LRSPVAARALEFQLLGQGRGQEPLRRGDSASKKESIRRVAEPYPDFTLLGTGQAFAQETYRVTTRSCSSPQDAT